MAASLCETGPRGNGDLTAPLAYALNVYSHVGRLVLFKSSGCTEIDCRTFNASYCLRATGF